MKSKTNQIKLDIMEDVEKIKYYVAFSYLFVRPLFKSKLLEYFDFDIKRAYLVDKDDLNKFADYCDISIPRDFIEKRDKLNIDECYQNAFLDKEVKIVTVEDELYPPLLKEIPDFPLSLYYKGELNKNLYECPLAVVGSRNASTGAKLALNSLISNLNNTNITIVSGLAYGIDATAHKVAIDNNLKTIAVIGSGLDIRYPSQNKDLYEQIENGAGVVLSEYPLKTKPVPQNFPQRNRIVVGISKGTLVAEAKLKSGAMISANLTLDYNRELMCIPGSITNPNTEGIYHLIKNGAGIIVNPEDILNQMDWEVKTPINNQKKAQTNDLQTKILDIIAIEPKSFDEIISSIDVLVSELMVVLTELEIKGLIVQENNKYYRV